MSYNQEVENFITVAKTVRDQKASYARVTAAALKSVENVKRLTIEIEREETKKRYLEKVKATEAEKDEKLREQESVKLYFLNMNNRNFMLNVVKQEGMALEHASDDLKGDKDLVREAVQQNWSALQHASADLKGDKDIVMEAVKQNGNALEHASADLQGDEELKRLACT